MPELSVLVAQIGARRHYAVPRALEAQSALLRLDVDASAEVAPWRWLDGPVAAGLQPRSLRRVLGRRVSGVPRAKIRGHFGWVLEGVIASPRFALAPTRWAQRNASFCRRVAHRDFESADTVYAFNGAALEIFEAAKQKGLRCILDQTAAPWRWNTSLLRCERKRWSGWEARPAEIDEDGTLTAREEAEWRLADLIICGSHFVVDAIEEVGGPAAKCKVVRYPASTSPTTAAPVIERQGSRRLRALFVGSLQLRKGIQYLWQASRQLGEDIEVRAVGPSLLSQSANNLLSQGIDLRGAVPRHDMPTHYAWAEVLVLPTLSEGSANVCHEAMALGLPVITTARAGSPVEHGLTGWIVPPADVDALAMALAEAAREPLRLRGMAAEASRVSSSRSLADYGADLVQAIQVA